MTNTRIITALIAFVATFIFSAGLVRIIFGTPEVQPAYYSRTRCKSAQAREIEKFVWQDVRNGEIRMDKISRKGGSNPSNVYFDDFARAVSEYAETSGRMDDANLPQDLQEAWREHMAAWGDFAVFLNETRPSSPEEFRGAEIGYNTEINRTWTNVLRISRSYGANVY
jgi:hypothetical protein